MPKKILASWGVKMKLLCVAPIRYPGHLGDAIRLPNLARYLTKKGHSVQFLIAFPKVRKKETLEINGVLVHRIPIKHRIQAPFKIWRLIKEYDCDLIYAYMPSIYSSIPASLTGQPFVLDCPDIIKTHQSIPLLGASIRKAEKIFVINQITKKFYVQRFKAEDRKFVILPNGVDESIFNSAVAPKTTERYDVIFAGRLYHLEELIEAARYVVKEYPDAIFLIIGNEDEDKYRAMVRGEGLERNFKFIGFVQHEEVPAYIAATKIGVNIFSNEPYYASAQPIKILEYMASGKPVVATNLPGTAEIIQHESQGFLYDAKDCQQLANYIIQLLDDNRLRGRMGKKGASTASKYSWNAIGERLLKVLEQII